MKKRNLAVILAATMVTSALAGCGQNAETQASAAPAASSEAVAPEASAALETGNAPEEKELITIKHLSLGRTSNQENFYNYVEDSELYKELVKRTGVQIEEYGLADDQVQVRIASGDLGDMISLKNTDQLYDLVESGLVIPLNELLEKYAPEIIEQYPARWEHAVSLYPNDEGLAYALPVKAGKEGWRRDTQRYLYTVRWDLYKQLGYPEMKNPDDLINVLSDMVELQPTTEDGKKVYGTGFYLEDSGFFGFDHTFAATYGMTNVKGHFITRDVKTDELIYDMINTKSPYWMAAEYFNKAYRAGILDPDSFTQKAADFDAKFTSGECLGSVYYQEKYWNASQLAKNPESTNGFMVIPVEGTMVWQNADKFNGWENASHAICIPTSCENPERVVEFIKYMFSEEGSRLVMSGIEGVHWDYVDGVPTFNEETFEIVAEAGEEFKKLALNMPPISYMAGIAVAETASDGYLISLQDDTAFMSKIKNTPTQEEYCEYYGVDYPIQLLKNLVEEGKMYDLSTQDCRFALNATNEDISRIDSACFKIAKEAIPKLVTATDDAAFEAVKAETLSALEAAGAREAEAYYTAEWENVKAKFAN